MGNENPEQNKYCALEVTKYMSQKVCPIIKPGDTIIVSFKKEDKPLHGQYVLVSLNERQWIEKYWDGLKKRYQNIYLIVKIIMH